MWQKILNWLPGVGFTSGFLGSIAYGHPLVVNGTGLNQQATNIAAGGVGALVAWLAAKYLPGVKLPNLGSESTANGEFSRAVDAVKVLDDFLGDEPTTLNSRRKILLAIFDKCRECKSNAEHDHL